MLFREAQTLLLSCVHIWNDFEIYKVRDHFFSRMGLFPYSKEDDRRMEEKIATVTSRIEQQSLLK